MADGLRYIGSTYYAADAQNPTDACQLCQPTTSTSGGTNVANGTACGNGQVCASGTCGKQCDIGDGGIVAADTPDPAKGFPGK
jgi:hypothetical protein